ncbi:acetate kinase [Microbacterium amylolyticum]|uniref:Acetate kinase n=1 Tax=Microbacterium amylolyticum TaxID=936337 RepID=A0ABS4ZJJ4_9MICO|nr:acetate kinase [Microbacterium amylolyticum]MBP2437454.1 acetate kinase [Microbacterium amylolyticum]
MSVILVVNSGSSSFKYQLIDMVGETTLASGLVERIGAQLGQAEHTVAGVSHDIARQIPDHTTGFQVMLDAFAAHGPSLAENAPTAVGHRVVHGGARFFEATEITDLVEINIDELSVLAPLHNPGALQGIRAARAAFVDVPHVAVFDTAFHQSMPAEAYTYAIDRDVAERHRIRRYGFHGTSHKFVSEAAAAYLQRPLSELKQIVFHLGNGASVTAVDGGSPIDTSMGLTPLEGLVMGTRSGDLDPAILIHLARRAKMSIDDIDEFLNKKSGLVGLAGVSDMRDLQAARTAGDNNAALALDVYAHRLRGYAGAYAAELGGLDVISFTAGVGENVPAVRREALAGLDFFGVEVDDERNENAVRGQISRISSDASRVTVLVVPTNEELEIARQSYAITN